MATSTPRTKVKADPKVPAKPKAEPKTRTKAAAEVAPVRRTPSAAAPSTTAPKKAAADLGKLEAALLAAIVEHHSGADLVPVKAAFALAVDAHTGQLRATGEPYVTHPIASAQILADLGIEPVAIEAALLHDVPEDTEYSLTDV